MKLTTFRWRFCLVVLLGLCLGGAQQALAQATRGTTSNRGGGSTGTRTGGGGGGGGSSSSSTRSYNAAGTMGDATITDDPETKSIVVITDEDTSESIGQIIKSLDKPKPQVLIKVVFLEVTHTDDSDLGIEGSYTHKLSNTTTGILSTAFGAAQQTSGGFYKVLSDDFQVTLHTLTTAGKTEVLSRPSVLARNNQMATIVVGQNVPLITATTINSYGQQINSVSYTDVGIILKVTPFITSDNMVEMIVNPTISSLTDQTVQIAAGVSVPIIATRSADTVVVTPDGMPVVIGGLLQNQLIDSTHKVPILGDIPLLGWAFKRDVKTDAKTELIMILVPHIMRSAEDLAAMSKNETDQTRMAPKVFSQELLDQYIDSLPMKKDQPLIKSKKPQPKKKKTSTPPENRSKM